jgi:hypothetical protein
MVASTSTEPVVLQTDLLGLDPGLVFVLVTLVVLALFALATVYYLPRALGEEEESEEENDHGSGGHPS